MSEPSTIEPEVTRSGWYMWCGAVRWWLIGPGGSQMFPCSATDFSPRPKMTHEERIRVRDVLRWINQLHINRSEITDEAITSKLKAP